MWRRRSLVPADNEDHVWLVRIPTATRSAGQHPIGNSVVFFPVCRVLCSSTSVLFCDVPGATTGPCGARCAVLRSLALRSRGAPARRPRVAGLLTRFRLVPRRARRAHLRSFLRRARCDNWALRRQNLVTFAMCPNTRVLCTSYQGEHHARLARAPAEPAKRVWWCGGGPTRVDQHTAFAALSCASLFVLTGAEHAPSSLQSN